MSASKYIRHQGAREKARRLKQQSQLVDRGAQAAGKADADETELARVSVYDEHTKSFPWRVADEGAR